MPKKVKEKTSIQVKRLKKPGLHAVGGVSGLLLQVTDTSKSWILRTMVGKRRPDIGLGGYPDVTLAQAREKAREFKEQIRKGIDPVAERKAARNALKSLQAKTITFDEAARRCHAAKSPEFRNIKHRQQWLNTITRYASPVIGFLPVNEIQLPHIMQVLEPVWHTKTETASRLRQRIEAVLTWATVSGFRSGDNPARWQGNLKELLPAARKIKKVQHHAALPWQDTGSFMAELRKREGLGARALEFAILTAARSGEVRGMTWDEVDLSAKVWTVPEQRIKAGKAHKIPLSSEAVKLLKALPKFIDSAHVFPASRGGQLSDMALTSVLRRMEVDATVHGFRSTFKDWARNCTAYPDEVSELALAHVNSDATRAAYARDELLAKRTRLMKDWSKFCGSVKKSGKVVHIRRGRA
jgi:integrase